MAVRAEAEEVIGRKGERGCFIIPTQQAILVAEVCQILLLFFLDMVLPHHLPNGGWG